MPKGGKKYSKGKAAAKKHSKKGVRKSMTTHK